MRERLVRRLPRPVQIVIGVLALLVGLSLITRPFASLAALVALLVIGLLVLAVGELGDAAEDPDPRAARAQALVWLLGALVLAFWPGLGIRAVAVVVGVSLLIGGVTDVVRSVRGSRPERIAGFIHGAASAILGLLALAWPDVTVLVIAVVFGARLAWYGVTTLWTAVRPRSTRDDAAASTPGLLLRSWHVMRALVGLAVVLLLLVISTKLHGGNPKPDDFYSAPDEVPSQPGQLLRSEPFDRAIPDGARAWRILYTTTRDEGVPAVASALVVAPSQAPAEPSPVIAWAHGTTGFAEGCAPTLLKDPLGSGAAPAVQQVIDNGWVMVATDYVGLGTEGPHPYLIGQGEGRSVLDAVRAAHQLEDLSLQDQTVVRGHSQGGNAALWAGQLADSYAPDDNVVGVAALAPASNLTGLVSNLGDVPGGSIFASYIVEAYSQIYDDVDFDHYIRASARIPVHEMASRCLAEPEVFVSIVSSLTFDKPIMSTDPREGAFGKRLAENTPTDPISAPLFIGQGEADALVIPSAQADYVAERCQLGPLEYQTYPGFDHVGVVGPDSPLIPDLLQWTQDRLDGKPAPSTC